MAPGSLNQVGELRVKQPYCLETEWFITCEWRGFGRFN